ncbi:MAG: glycosyltransferase family 4 protein [Saprospiraceae bacterium]
MYKLAFDAKRLFNNATGLGNYSRTLLQNLSEYYPEQEYHLFSPKIKKQLFNQHFINNPAFQLHTASNSPGAWWRTYGLKKDLLKNDIDLYHGLSHEIPLGLSNSKIKTIVTIHDLIIKTWPQTFNSIDRKIYDQKFRYACKNADHIIAISESTKVDIMKYYGTQASKISVVYQTCGPQFRIIQSLTHIQEVKRRYALPSEYLLYVGSIIERKNLLGLLKAIYVLPRLRKLPLVVIGQGKGTYFQKVKRFIEKEKMTSLIHFPKGVSNEDLPAVYQGAEVFCYPSHYEGFGIPVLEALFCKTPVITSNTSSLPEAAGPDAFFVDPTNIEDIANQLNNALTNSELRKNSVEKGFAYAQQFEGKKLTEQMMGIYQQLLNK